MNNTCFFLIGKNEKKELKEGERSNEKKKFFVFTPWEYNNLLGCRRVFGLDLLRIYMQKTEGNTIDAWFR